MNDISIYKVCTPFIVQCTPWYTYIYISIYIYIDVYMLRRYMDRIRMVGTDVCSKYVFKTELLHIGFLLSPP